MAEATFAFDLHVLSTPPAFNLSQNQTLQFKSVQRFLLGRNQNLKVLFPLALHLSMNQKKSFSLPPFFAAFVNMLFCHRFVNNFFGNLQKTFCEGFLEPRCFTAARGFFTLIPHACQQLFSLFPGNLLSGTFREGLLSGVFKASSLSSRCCQQKFENLSQFSGRKKPQPPYLAPSTPISVSRPLRSSMVILRLSTAIYPRETRCERFRERVSRAVPNMPARSSRDISSSMVSLMP